MRMPSLQYLRTFQVAGRHLSFKDAADELAVTASAVSHQIRRLEQFLGVRLFRRLTRSLEFTEAGQRYFLFLDTLFARLESETQQLASEYVRNIIRLSVPPFFASEALLPRLLSFQAALPDTDIRVTTRSSGIAEHPSHADLSILLGDSLPEDLETHRLFARRIVVACAHGYLAANPIREFADLNRQTLLVHDHWPDAWESWAREVGAPVPVAAKVLRSDSMSVIARAAQQGLGVALISWPLGRDWFRPDSLTRVFDDEVDTGKHFYVVLRLEDAVRDDVAQLRDWLTTEFRNYT